MTRYVVVGMDGSQDSLAAARWAAAEAAVRKQALRMVAAVPPQGAMRWPEKRSPIAGVMDSAVDEFSRAHPGLEVAAREIPGGAEAVLDDISRAADLLVVGTRGLGGFIGLRLGSVALAIAADAHCAVALIPAEGTAAPRSAEVALGVDGHHPDARAIDLAFAAAQRGQTPLRAVSAWQIPESPGGEPPAAAAAERAGAEDQEVQLLEAALRPWREKYPSVAVVPDVRRLGAADALVRASTSADLMVVGRGEAGNVHNLGGVAHAVAHHTRCPLILAPRH